MYTYSAQKIKRGQMTVLAVLLVLMLAQLQANSLLDKKNNKLSSLKLRPVVFEMVKGKYLYSEGFQVSFLLWEKCNLVFSQKNVRVADTFPFSWSPKRRNDPQIRTKPFREFLLRKIFFTPSSIFHLRPRESRTCTRTPVHDMLHATHIESQFGTVASLYNSYIRK